MRISATILKKWIDSEYSGIVHKQSDSEWIVKSFYNPNKMKTYINMDKGVGIDFISGIGYSPFEIIKELGEFPDNESTQKALQKFILKNLGSIDLSSEIYNSPAMEKQKPEVVIIDIPPEFIPIKSNHFITKRAYAYMRSRGYTDEDFTKYHIMVSTSGKFRGRVIIPFIEDGKMVWFQGRSLRDSDKYKYLNPKGVSKSILVFNIDNIVDRAIITEGVMDAMTVGGVAIQGATISDWQVDKILAKNPKEIIIAPDNDKTYVRFGKKMNAGYDGAAKTIEKFIRMGYNKDCIKVAFVDDGKDFSQMGKAKAFECIDKAQNLGVLSWLRFKEKGVENKFLDKVL